MIDVSGDNKYENIKIEVDLINRRTAQCPSFCAFIASASRGALISFATLSIALGIPAAVRLVGATRNDRCVHRCYQGDDDVSMYTRRSCCGDGGYWQQAQLMSTSHGRKFLYFVRCCRSGGFWAFCTTGHVQPQSIFCMSRFVCKDM